MDCPDSGTSDLIVGLIGIGGALLGVLVQFGLTTWRESRGQRARRRRAVAAVVRELVSTVSILDMALRRQAWWSEGDEPLSVEWESYRDDLAQEVDLETFTKIGFVYDSIRSLVATRSSPMSPTVGDFSPRGLRLRWFLRKDTEQRSFLHLIWLPERWPEADANVRNTLNATWEALGALRPVQLRLLSRGERKQWKEAERRAAEQGGADSDEEVSAT
jgi:hypothetical protein